MGDNLVVLLLQDLAWLLIYSGYRSGTSKYAMMVGDYLSLFLYMCICNTKK